MEVRGWEGEGGKERERERRKDGESEGEKEGEGVEEGERVRKREVVIFLSEVGMIQWEWFCDHNEIHWVYALYIKDKYCTYVLKILRQVVIGHYNYLMNQHKHFFETEKYFWIRTVQITVIK